MDAPERFFDLHPVKVVTCVVAQIIAAVAAIVSLLGVILYGAPLVELMLSGGAVLEAETLGSRPIAVFVGMLFLTTIAFILGVMNLRVASRWREFFKLGWKLYLRNSSVPLVLIILVIVFGDA